MQINELKIHIVGGTGQMGNWLRIFLQSQGLAVTVSGSKDSLAGPVKIADIVFISVPISVAAQVIVDIAKVVKRGCILVDLSSVKSGVCRILKKTKLPSVAVHFLFGPTVPSVQNQKIIFCRIQDHQLVTLLKELFEKTGAHVIEMSPQRHDQIMAHIQSLTHFINLNLGEILIKNKIDLSGKISTPVFLVQASSLSRVITQPPGLLSEIQLGNEEYLPLLSEFIKNQQDWLKIIKIGDKKTLEKKITKINGTLDSVPKPHLVLPTGKYTTHTKLSKDMKVGYLGPMGTFSHQAAKRLINNSGLVSCKTIYEIFEAVKQGRVNFGLVPAENSIEGTVRETLDYILDFGFQVNLYVDLPIHQNLLSKGTDLKSITRVISHPQAIAQSRIWLQQHLPLVKVEGANSTISAVDELKDETAAMIGSAVAAEIYKLNILAKNIESNHHNTTRFYLVSKKQGTLNPKSTKTLLFLTVFNRVGILRDILDVFAENDINLSKLESRPSKEKLWDYYFFVEVEAGQDDQRLIQSLNLLKQYCPKILVLGGG